MKYNYLSLKYFRHFIVILSLLFVCTYVQETTNLNLHIHSIWLLVFYYNISFNKINSYKAMQICYLLGICTSLLPIEMCCEKKLPLYISVAFIKSFTPLAVEDLWTINLITVDPKTRFDSTWPYEAMATALQFHRIDYRHGWFEHDSRGKRQITSAAPYIV